MSVETMPAHRHDHTVCITTALEEADRLCAARGVRLTALRRRVLELVWQNHRAVKAYDLLAALSEEDEKAAKPPTVYRALDFLIKEGLVHKIESLNAFVGCPEPEHRHVGRFMICQACETVTEINSPLMDGAVKALVDEAGFALSGETIELFGTCRSCGPDA